MSKRRFLKADELAQIPELEAWRQDFLAANLRMYAFMDEIGADRSFGFRFAPPSGFRFPGKVPENWTAPRAKDGFSAPYKKNEADIARIKALGFPESLSLAVTRIYPLPTSLGYVQPDGRRGTQSLSGMYPFDMGWPNGDTAPVLLVIPDYEAIAEGVLHRHPDATLTWTTFRYGQTEVTEPFVPAGFEVISEAEASLVYAEARVARERLAQAATVTESQP